MAKRKTHINMNTLFVYLYKGVILIDQGANALGKNIQTSHNERQMQIKPVNNAAYSYATGGGTNKLA